MLQKSILHKSKNKGVAVILSLILLSFAVMFTSMLAYFYVSSATSYAKSVVMDNQLKTIDSFAATDVMSIILLLPHGGRVTYIMSNMPTDVAGNYYEVKLNIGNGNEGFVNTTCKGYTISLCIGGFGAEINGSINKTKIILSR